MKKRFFLHKFMLMILLIFTAFLLTGMVSGEESGELFPFFNQWMKTVNEGTPYQVEGSISIHDLVPFQEETVVNLNRLLSHVGTKFYIHKPQENTLHWETFFTLGGNPFFSLGGLNEPDKNTQWGLEGKIGPFSSKKMSPLYSLLGVTEVFEDKGEVQIPSFATAKDELDDFILHIPIEHEEKKSNFKFKNIGNAAKVQTFSFSEENINGLQLFLSQLSSSLSWEWGKAENDLIQYSGKGTLKIYFTKEEEFLGLEVKTQGLLNETVHDIEIMWATNENKDRFKIHIPAEKGKNRFTLEGEIIRDIAKQELEITGSIKYRNDDVHIEKKLLGKASGLVAEDNERINGEITITTLQGEDTSIITIQPSFLTTLNQELNNKGNIRLIWEKNKKLQGDISLSLIAEPTQSKETYLQNPIDFDLLSEKEKQNFANQITNSFSSAFIKEAFTLPLSELLFIVEGLSEENISQLYEIVPLR